MCNGSIESGQGRRRAEAEGITTDELYAEQGKSIPLGRVGTGDEFADLVSYLALLTARSASLRHRHGDQPRRRSLSPVL